MSHIPDDASSMSDDVFEDPETQQRRLEELARHRATDYSSMGASSTTPSTSTGYPGYRPPAKALQMYALEDTVFQDDGDDDEYDDGWRSYRYDEVGMHSHPAQHPFDDTINHKTILLGDSGVGKTSFLVKYNTGEFRLGSFSATVGIALTNMTARVFGAILKHRKKYLYWPDCDERKILVGETLNELPHCIGYVDGTEIKLAEKPIGDPLILHFK